VAVAIGRQAMWGMLHTVLRPTPDDKGWAQGQNGMISSPKTNAPDGRKQLLIRVGKDCRMDQLSSLNVLVQWHGFQPTASGFVPLSIAEFGL
jgi:hypothetical protein